VLYAAMQVDSGTARLVVADGVESMSQVEHCDLGCDAEPVETVWS
jgi:acetyl-CoA acetyltransferase